MPRCANFHRDRGQNAYQSDSFRMWDFKVKLCPKTGPHDWTQCPFAHQGEKANRRDLQQFIYSGIPCSDFQKTGTCPREDLCPQAHGVFESWLHPSRYRTKLCKEGADCTRRVCFFAHNQGELRHLEGGPFFPDASPEQLIRAFPDPSTYDLWRRPGAGNQSGLLSLQGQSGDMSSQRAAQLRAMANSNTLDLNTLSAAQLRWLAACVASMPQQPQEQLPMQPPGMTAGGMHPNGQNVFDISMSDDDPIKADLSHGIMSTASLMNANASYFDPSPTSQASLNGGLPINQKLKSWGTESSMGMPGFPLDMDMPSGHGPLDASLRPDLQAQFPHTSFSQGLLGTPDWSNNALMPGKMPESYLNSCDLDMWN